MTREFLSSTSSFHNLLYVSFAIVGQDHSLFDMICSMCLLHHTLVYTQESFRPSNAGHGVLVRLKLESQAVQHDRRCRSDGNSVNAETGGSIWTEHSQDPSQWWDYQAAQTAGAFRNFSQKLYKEPLWIDRCPVREDPGERRLQPLESSAEEEKEEEEEYNGHACLGKERNAKMRLTNSRAQVEEEVLITSSNNQQKVQLEEEEEALITSINDQQKLQVAPIERHTLLALLKACAAQKDLHQGSRVHASVVRMGLLHGDIYMGSTLVNMYAKCSSLLKAQEVFDNLSSKTVVLWNVLIAGYAQHGLDEQALKCFDRMQCEGFSPDAITYVSVLKACGGMGAARKGIGVHAEIESKGFLDNDIFIGNALIDMYAKCGLLVKAQEVFDSLLVRDVVTWNALIAGYTQHSHGAQAVNCFERMQLEGLPPSPVTFVCVLKACGSIGAADKGQALHSKIIRNGYLEKYLIVSNSLIDMYVKCGLFAKAQAVFDKLLFRNVISWSVLIAGYAQHSHGEQALNCFEAMQHEGLSPNAVTFACILKACGSIGAADKGQEIYKMIMKEKLLEKDIIIGNALVDMFAKCGLLAEAQEVFNTLPSRDTFSWNVLIAGYAQHGHGGEALSCFLSMQLDGLYPDAITYACILKACVTIGAIDKGQEIHADIVRAGLLGKDDVIGISLVDMYAKSGFLVKAQEMFDIFGVSDIVLWSALIGGYAQHGHAVEVLKCVEHMQLEGLYPDVVTYIYTLKACGSLGDAGKGQEMHATIVRDGLLEKDMGIGNALVDMYIKSDLLGKAKEVFDILPSRTVVSWSVLIAAYAEQGHGAQALHCFEEMQFEGLLPNAGTFVCVLKACSSIGAGSKGQAIHDKIVKDGMLEEDIILGTTVVDMYVKCGLLAKAQEVFDEFPFRNVVLWNVLIAGHALLGKADDVFILFDRMVGEGVGPDSVTFTNMLTACSHRGLLDMAQMYFQTMTRGYGIIPTLEHYSCMINSFCRAGHLGKAVAVIKEMPLSADIMVWHTVLDACGKGGNMKLAKMAFKSALQLDEKDGSAYVCMGNIYAASGWQNEAYGVASVAGSLAPEILDSLTS